MGQLFITFTGLSVYEVPPSGLLDILDIRDGYIVSPGYPSNYPNEANGDIEITASPLEVSLSHQIIYHRIDSSTYGTYMLPSYSYGPGSHSPLKTLY